MRKVLATLFVIAALLLIVGTALPVTDLRQWWVRGLDFPRLQIAIALIAMLLIYLVWHWKGDPPSMLWPLLLLICTAYQLYWIWPYTPVHPVEVRLVEANQASLLPRLKILSSNVLMDNRNASALLAHVKREQPNILITLESDQWWQDQLDTLPEYEHRLAQPLDNKYGMHLYSNLPMHDAAIEFLVEDDIPSMVAFIELPEGQQVRLHILHPTPPAPGENTRSTERDVELLILANRLEDNRDVTVVVGDLNDVAWSKTTQLFRNIADLLDPRVGRGMFNSFHAGYWFARWPLDHVFVSSHFRLVEVRRLSSIGSDHFPVMIDLAISTSVELDSHPDDEDIDKELERKTLDSTVGREALKRLD